MDRQRKLWTWSPSSNSGEPLPGKMECSLLWPETLCRGNNRCYEESIALGENFPRAYAKVYNVTIIFYVNTCSVKWTYCDLIRRPDSLAVSNK